MKKNTKVVSASVFFLAIVVLHILGLLYNDKLAFLTKPFITISLVVIYLLSVNKVSFWYVSALFFSFWGDTFLLFKEAFFLFGLVSFLIAHILYIKISSNYLKKISFKKIITYSIPFVIAFGSIVYLIRANLGDMLVPVIIYGLVIATFGTLTLLNYVQQKTTENLWLFLGAFIFIVSDSLLAINKFYEASEIYGISIMVTYIVAQYLICKAMVVKDSQSLKKQLQV
ncbi:lysoplasmalogenase [Polaribacter sp. IC073]|uniref:lysoplasmalogenase n=1 Tax=Polaribacter sp. IC073 TaxID=2508540 RepID=UPI0011BF528A|nr:lysoplasmalogenase [Polaribacter sp. IC073]TXD47255.1 lysoplasmalogenase [Polaribacter sp. IC073]